MVRRASPSCSSYDDGSLQEPFWWRVQKPSESAGSIIPGSLHGVVVGCLWDTTRARVEAGRRVFVDGARCAADVHALSGRWRSHANNESESCRGALFLCEAETISVAHSALAVGGARRRHSVEFRKLYTRMKWRSAAPTFDLLAPYTAGWGPMPGVESKKRILIP